MSSLDAAAVPLLFRRCSAANRNLFHRTLLDSLVLRSSRGDRPYGRLYARPTKTCLVYAPGVQQRSYHHAGTLEHLGTRFRFLEEAVVLQFESANHRRGFWL